MVEKSPDKLNNFKRFTKTQLQRDFGTVSDLAQKEPVILTSHARDRLVLLDATLFAEMMEIKEAYLDMRKTKAKEEFLKSHKRTFDILAME